MSGAVTVDCAGSRSSSVLEWLQMPLASQESAS